MRSNRIGTPRSEIFLHYDPFSSSFGALVIETQIITMRTISIQIGIAGAIGLLSYPTFAQTWQTVDDFQPATNGYAVAQAMCKDPAGNLYAAGQADNPNDPYDNVVAAIRKSRDGGNTWSVVDFCANEMVATNFDAFWYEYNGIASDSAGRLYAVGDDFWNGYWFVRRSVDSGLTWQAVDFLTGAATAGDGCGRKDLRDWS